MSSFMVLFMFFSLLLLFSQTQNLLVSLLILELLGLSAVFLTSIILNPLMDSDFLLLIFFSVFIMESVLGLFGLILVVSFTGSDYLSSSSLTRC